MCVSQCRVFASIEIRENARWSLAPQNHKQTNTNRQIIHTQIIHVNTTHLPCKHHTPGKQRVTASSAKRFHSPTRNINICIICIIHKTNNIEFPLVQYVLRPTSALNRMVEFQPNSPLQSPCRNSDAYQQAGHTRATPTHKQRPQSC